MLDSVYWYLVVEMWLFRVMFCIGLRYSVMLGMFVIVVCRLGSILFRLLWLVWFFSMIDSWFWLRVGLIELVLMNVVMLVIVGFLCKVFVIVLVCVFICGNVMFLLVCIMLVIRLVFCLGSRFLGMVMYSSMVIMIVIEVISMVRCW